VLILGSVWLPLGVGAVGGTAAALLGRLVDVFEARRSERRKLRSAARLYADELERFAEVLDAVWGYRAWLGDEWPDGWDEYRRDFTAAGVKGRDWEKLQTAHRASASARAAREHAIEEARTTGGLKYDLAGRDFSTFRQWQEQAREALEVLERLSH
jgi:hypothetical protein